jgi:hypothetical protein
VSLIHHFFTYLWSKSQNINVFSPNFRSILFDVDVINIIMRDKRHKIVSEALMSVASKASGAKSLISLPPKKSHLCMFFCFLFVFLCFFVCLRALYRPNALFDFDQIWRGPICVCNLDPLLFFFLAKSAKQFRN